MKRKAATVCIAILLCYVLLGLQSTLYFLPFPSPALWIVVFCSISFFCSLSESILFNVFLVLTLGQFSVVNPVPLVIVLNAFSFSIKAIQNRFHLNNQQISLSFGFFCFAIQFALFLLQKPTSYDPGWVNWITLSVSTGIFAPFLFYPLVRLDSLRAGDPLEGLELNL